MAHVYLSDNPELCVCQGTGWFWAVVVSGSIANVFPVPPAFEHLPAELVRCPKHAAVKEFSPINLDVNDEEFLILLTGSPTGS